jgi:hypothetical protein
LRFYVSMHYSHRVTIVKSLESLIEVVLAIFGFYDFQKFFVLNGIDMLEHQAVDISLPKMLMSEWYFTISKSLITLFSPFKAMRIFIYLFIFLNFTLLIAESTWFEHFYYTTLRVEHINGLKYFRVLSPSNFFFTQIVRALTYLWTSRYLQMRFWVF